MKHEHKKFIDTKRVETKQQPNGEWETKAVTKCEDCGEKLTIKGKMKKIYEQPEWFEIWEKK